MCYYYGRKVTRDEYNRFKEEEKKVAFLSKDYAIFKGFDHNDLPVLRLNKGTGEVERVTMVWGMLPSSIRTKEAAAEFQKKYTTLNFVSEEVQTKQLYKNSLNTRCLVEFDKFYEWMHVQLVGKSGKLLKTPEKFPYLIELTEPGPHYFPGIYNEHNNTFVFATTAANSLMKIIHNSKERMPTILPGDLHKDWLNPGLSVTDILDLCNYQTATAQMKATPLHKDFFKRENPHEAMIYEGVPGTAAA